jgi:hypothetical protein
MEITKKNQDDFRAALKSVLDENDFINGCTHECFVHYFKGFGIHPSVCRVHLFAFRENTIVVFEDMGNDTGTSITNASEQLATEIANLKNLDVNKTGWMECYPRYSTDFPIDRIIYTYDAEQKKYRGARWSRCQDMTILKYFRKRITL